MSKFKINDVITNGASAGCVIELVAKDKTWGTSGVRVQNIGLEMYDGNVGYSSFVPDYLLSNWRLVPMDWSPVLGGRAEERYIWTAGHARLVRQVRAVRVKHAPGD